MKVQILFPGVGAHILHVTSAKARNGNIYLVISTKEKHPHPEILVSTDRLGNTSYGVSFRRDGWETKPEDKPTEGDQATTVMFEPEGEQEITYFSESTLLQCSAKYGFNGYLVLMATSENLEKSKTYYVSPT